MLKKRTMKNFDLPCVVSYVDDRDEKKSYSISGILIDPLHRLVLTHGSLITPFIQDCPSVLNELQKQSFSNLEQKNVKVNVIMCSSSSKQSGMVTASNQTPGHRFHAEMFNCALNTDFNPKPLETFPGKAVCIFRCKEFHEGLSVLFTTNAGWTLNESSKDRDMDQILEALMSSFLLIQLNSKLSGSNHKPLPVSTDYHIGDTTEIIATPFATLSPEIFFNSHSDGVVSNVCGQAIVLTDARCIPGSEGGPVFVKDSRNNRELLGVVVTPLCWRNNEWIGLTIVCSLQAILKELNHLIFGQGLQVDFDCPSFSEGNKYVISSPCKSVVFVRCGATFGSGVLIDARAGLILTCSHVIKWGSNPTVVVKFHETDGWYKCRMLHSTPSGSQFDIALLQLCLDLPNGQTAVSISTLPPRKGDRVYVVGHALFDEDSGLPPSITTGVVSNITLVNNLPVLLQTSCAVHSGASGGAVLDDQGKLIGLVVCNAKDVDSGASFPHINLSIPLYTIQSILKQYQKTEDVEVLKSLHVKSKLVKKYWNLGVEKTGNEESIKTGSKL